MIWSGTCPRSQVMMEPPGHRAQSICGWPGGPSQINSSCSLASEARVPTNFGASISLLGSLLHALGLGGTGG